MKRVPLMLWLWLAGAVAAPAGTHWSKLADLKAGGDGKEVSVNRAVTRCRITCTEGSVIINTLVVREGGKKTPIKVVSRIPKGESREIRVADRPLNVSGFRIGDDGRGRYIVEVDGGGKDEKRAEQKRQEEVDEQVGDVLGRSGTTVQPVTSTLAALLQSAQAGDRNAQYQLATAYLAGDGVEASPSEGVRWLRKAGAQGHRDAAFDLGERYASGNGVLQDETEALSWYRRAAAAGHAQAQARVRDMERELGASITGSAGSSSGGYTAPVTTSSGSASGGSSGSILDEEPPQ